MSVDCELDFERPITFNEASRFLPNGYRPSHATWWRWWKKGLRGIRLRTLLCGGRRFTTPSAVIEFFSQVTAAAAGEKPLGRTPNQRARAIVAAEAELGITAPKAGEAAG